MPTFTAIAFDRFIEPGAAPSKLTEKPVSDLKSVPRPREQTEETSRKLNRNGTSRGNSVSSATMATATTVAATNSRTAGTTEKKYHWSRISPALYATPEVTPVPDSPSSYPPSPYIINHKRRGPRLVKSQSEANVAADKDVKDGLEVNGTGDETKSEGAAEANVAADKDVKDGLEVNGTGDETKSEGAADSPSSYPPSPYIINHKRRGPRLVKSQSEANVAADKDVKDGMEVNGTGDETKSEGAAEVRTDALVSFDDVVPAQIHVDGFRIENGNSSKFPDCVVGENDQEKKEMLIPGSCGESEDFFDPRDSLSYSSNTDAEDNCGTEQSVKFGTTSGTAEFYDAWEELSSDGGQQLHLPLRDIEAELREMRLSLLMEIEKRKEAEDALNIMRTQWQKIREQLSLVGLTFPADSALLEQGNELEDSDSAENLCQQVYIARFVSNCIGRSIAKAEAEIELEDQIESKNFEIARLCDRLNYYDAVNREMSQRNQEAVETARRVQQRRSQTKKWVWGSIATAITLGTAALAWSYIPVGKGSSLTSSSSQTHESGSVAEGLASNQ